MKRLLLLAAALVAGPGVAAAQAPGESATYLALVHTPIGALTPMLTNTLIGRLQNGATLGLRYGYLNRDTAKVRNNAFAVTAVMPAGLGSAFSITGGALSADCSGCRTTLLLSGSGEMRIVSSALDASAASSLWTVSLAGELGYGNRDPGSSVSGYVGAPVALVQRGSGMAFVPFITPGFGFAQTSISGNSTSGSAFMLGGGLGVYNSESSVVVNVGAQYVFLPGAQTTLGINVMIGGR